MAARYHAWSKLRMTLAPVSIAAYPGFRLNAQR
jgi:hypothetical protein